MNILFTSNRFYPDIGGIESISGILAHHFVKAGHSLRLVTQSAGSADEDCATYPFPIVRRPRVAELLACYRWADVVFQNNIEIRALWPQLLVRRPLMIALHTWLRSAAGRRRAVDRFKQLLLGTANRVVSVSQAIRDDSFPGSTVIGNPYRSTMFCRVPGIEREKSIVYLGRLVSDKGVDLLLRSFADLRPPEWRLSIIGSGPERDALERLAVELRISPSVHFLGALQGDALVRELNRHELMVIPSRWREPFGVVALEGLACGCVLLASDGGGLPDAVGPAGLLFRRGDPADLTRQLHLLLHDGELRARLRSQAPAHLARFEEDQVCSHYLELLEGMVRPPSCFAR
ncbi:MAG: glycosyltransferase family 4 protein [Prochlorococcaceae cyanobacterium]